VHSLYFLAQLLHNYNLKELYNDDYGYRSGINQAMVKHLTGITKDIKKIVKFKKGDYVLDIASNDATLLKSYKLSGVNCVGIDPTVSRFKNFYPKNFKTKSVLFSKHQYLNLTKREKAKAITSIAVFYDVINPNRFVSDVKDILCENGVWVMEQSYLPILIKNNGSNVASLGKALKISTELVAAVVVGTALGFILDNWLDTRPWLTISFFIMGVVAGILNVIKSAKKMHKNFKK